MLVWGGGKKEEMSITTTMSPNMFNRGDRIQMSGFVNDTKANGLFVVRRAKGTQYLIEPAGWWDYVTHYASKFGQWVRSHYYGVIDTVGDTWKRLRKKLS